MKTREPEDYVAILLAFVLIGLCWWALIAAAGWY